MLLWISLAVLIIGIICIVLYQTTSAGDWCWCVGTAITLVGALALIICAIVLFSTYAGLDGSIAENKARHESLTYQYENNLYDNDNDLGKKELMNEIREWNEDLAWYRENQDDFWIGIFIPDIFDQFEFIEYT